jgi:parallel beta-helix repeat protein
MIHRLVFSLGGALLAALASVAAAGFAIPAAAGPVTSLTSCQKAVLTPGTYRLDADIDGTNVDQCFVLGKDVMLILNGHTITGFPGRFVDVGIVAEGSGDTIVGPGTLTEWGLAGIELLGGSGSVRGVTATENPDAGIRIQSDGNSVRGNDATDNVFGIEVTFGSGNTIIGNTATGNPHDDLFDASGTCTNNVWQGNDFGTANPSCIR